KGKEKELPSLWPQLAMGQSDCYACHHELQRPSWRQVRGFNGRPGRPQIRPWPMALARQGLGSDGDAATQLQKSLAELYLACDVRPFGDPAKVAGAADKLKAWSQGRLDADKLQEAKIDRLAALKKLCALTPNDYPDYDSAREIVAAIHVIYTEWSPK